jgi:single-strand DNA-binding protein
MANDLNHCTFIGRAGKDPELRYTPSGAAVANLSIACGWKGKDQEGVEWVNCVAYEKLAEIIGEYVKKGTQIFVSGRFTTRKWQDKDGHARYSTEIRLERMQLLGSSPTEERQERPTRSAQPARRAPAPAPAPRTGTGFDDMDSDIPF